MNATNTKTTYKIGFVRSRDDAKATISRIVVGQHDIAAQQGTPNRSVLTRVGQVRIVFPRRAVNGPPVQLKAFRALLLGNHQRQMVHAITWPQYSVKDRHQPGMRENGLKDGGIPAPLEDTTQILSSGTGAVQRSSRDGVA